MNNKINIENILRDFYLSSGLPIQAFDFNGYGLGQAGHRERFGRLLSSHNIYEKVIERLADSRTAFVTVSLMPNAYYTGCYISQGNEHSGIFLLGPYSCRNRNEMGFAYKPKCLIKYLVSLLRIIAEENIYSEKVRCLDDSIYNLHVRRAIDYINYRYAEDISLSTMANYLSINKSYFCSLFKEETGKTFTQYLNETRVHKSKYLLLETEDSILDIALAVGFNIQNYYNIIFKRIMKITPLNYRNKRENFK